MSQLLPMFTEGISPAKIPLDKPDPDITSYGELLSPGAVHIRLSNECQLRCGVCELNNELRGDKALEGDMPEAVWQAIYEKIVPHVRGVEVCGLGEPTISPLFPRVCADILKAGKVLYFPTNGLSLGSKKILDCIGDTPRVSVSLDSWDAESYDKIRPTAHGEKGTWDKVIRAVKKFRKAKPNAFLHSQFTATTLNIDGFPKFMEAARDLGVNEVTWRMAHNHAGAREDLSLRFAKTRTEAAITAAEKIAKDAGINLIVERRQYSEFNPDSLDDTTPEARLKRYLDFAPMSDPTCPGECFTYFTGTDGSTTTGTSTNTNAGADGPNAINLGYNVGYETYLTAYDDTILCTGCATSFNQVNATGTIGTSYYAEEFVVYGSQTFSITTTNIGWECSTTIYSTDGSTIWTTICTTTGITIDQTGSPPSLIVTNLGTFSVVSTYTSNTTTCSSAFNVYSCPPTTTLLAEDGGCGGNYGTTIGGVVYTTCIDGAAADELRWWINCNASCSTELYSNSAVSVQTSGWVCSGEFTGASEGAADVIPTLGVIRGKTAPRGSSQATASGFSAESLPAEPAADKPIKLTNAAIIAWADGDLTTCFARHSVGNVMKEGFNWADVLANPRYQAFLSRRQSGNVLSEPWCAACSRTF